MELTEILGKLPKKIQTENFQEFELKLLSKWKLKHFGITFMPSV